MTRSIFAVLALASTMLAGCGWFGDKLEQQKNWSVEQFYKNAKEELDSGNYAGAVKAYEALEAKYPFGRYAQQAQLDIAYARYKEGETAESVSAADRFMKLHPNHANVDYALYIKGLAYFKPDLGIFGDMLNLDPSERDPKALRESFEVFKDLAVRFPESRYADDARSRMSYLVNALAKHDVAVAKYYYNRGAYLAAVNRAENVMLRYPQAPANEDALVITVQAYEQMGLKDLAADARRVLEKNFPRNDMVAKGSSGQKSWWKLW
ncbi:MAG: outer membrane protein assembly factor BamD [Betaproteobacteria bacterium]